MLFVMALPVRAISTPQQDMQRLDTYIEQAITQAEAKDLQGVGSALKEFQDDWFDVEDGVKKTSRPASKDIETVCNNANQPEADNSSPGATSKLTDDNCQSACYYSN
jgi:hypothetical protein